MEKILASPYFKYFIVPLFAVGFSVFLKTVSRNDQYTAFKKEDLAIGLEIAVAALIIYITYCVTMADQIVSLINSGLNPGLLGSLKGKFLVVPWVLTAFVLGIWGMSTLVRRLGWKDQDSLNIFFGIVLPFIYGLLCLIFVINWIG